jgi:zinc protease
MERARTELVSAEELTKAKAMCITMDALSRQTNSDIGLQATLDELYGLGYDDSTKYEAGIQAVTAEDVRRVAQKYLTRSLTVRIGAEVQDSK